MENVFGKVIKEAFIISLISIVCGLLVNHFSPAGIALTGSWNTKKGVISANEKNDVVVHEREIQNVDIVKKIFDQGNTLFLDARTSEQYGEGHIHGSISLPVKQFDEWIGTLFEKYPPSTPIITYCSGRECRDSHELAQLLQDAGYENVKVFSDGYPAWEKKEYPIE
jgi:rhodanese-related sulfurtransferase